GVRKTAVANPGTPYRIARLHERPFLYQNLREVDVVRVIRIAVFMLMLNLNDGVGVGRMLAYDANFTSRNRMNIRSGRRGNVDSPVKVVPVIL
ncbi:MAG: hypothetical protein QGG73_11630, partial [Candidatus Hydrogenedentes bacterium]|nr:hypothetical protein [Candidatus Hydrogenedentota bacterium]